MRDGELLGSFLVRFRGCSSELRPSVNRHDGGRCPGAFIPESAFSVPGVELISAAYPVSSQTFLCTLGK